MKKTATLTTAGVFVIAKSAGSILIHNESTDRLNQTNFHSSMASQCEDPKESEVCNQ